MTNKKLAFMAIPVLAAIMIVGTFAPVSAGGASGIIGIDIKPGGLPNSINPSSNGVIPVAILGTSSVDVSVIDPTTLKFRASEDDPLISPNVIGFGFEDVNDDGFIDLVAHFRTQTTGIKCDTTQGQLDGNIFAGSSIIGFDSINPVGKNCRNNVG